MANSTRNQKIFIVTISPENRMGAIVEVYHTLELATKYIQSDLPEKNVHVMVEGSEYSYLDGFGRRVHIQLTIQYIRG